MLLRPVGFLFADTPISTPYSAGGPGSSTAFLERRKKKCVKRISLHAPHITNYALSVSYLSIRAVGPEYEERPLPP